MMTMLDDEGPSPEDLERFSDETGYCPSCGEEIWDLVDFCPKCHEPLPDGPASRPPVEADLRRRWRMLVIVLVIVGLVPALFAILRAIL